ncbi:dehydrogenase [Microlunatus endophyticus]|uniref:Dehydrogenase n=1 Tax=Microlunatus endophyticus TaxID=1716077 RepID=A0A917W4K9_9ACTN|nr:Gfo/Idh/MocA family oxidoreductase [Microlunatus endophyticus]GGL66876.1 dehydrogenase [Microlunatus endophyticus]
MAQGSGTVGIGLIGAGGITRGHVRGYNAIGDQVKVVAIADVVEENARTRAEEVGGADVLTNYGELVKRDDVDAVDICLPHHLHADAIITAANAGKYVLCEKPLCLTVAEADAVRQAVEHNGVTLMCAHNQLFMPAVARTRELLDAGTFGEIYELRTTDSFLSRATGSGGMTWRSRVATAGGGELIDTGYHPTYLLLHLAGSSPTQVAAMVSKHRLTFMEGEDSAQVLVRFDNGAVGTIVTGWAYTPAPGTERFSIVAEKGSLSSDGTTIDYQLNDEDPVRIDLPDVDNMAAEIADFVACVRDGKRPVNTEDEGIQVLKVILGAYQSARTGTIVDLASL